MENLHAFLAGPGLVIALTIFFGGLVFRLVRYFYGLDWRLDRVAYKPGLGMGLKGGLHSIGKWLLPFATHGWRSQPFFTIFFFLFHTGLVIVPLFLLGHNEILQVRLGCSLPSMPQYISDGLTVAALTAGVLLFMRRLLLPEVRILSAWQDYGVLLLSLAPLATGLINRLSGGESEVWFLCHLISAEMLLILAPFTRLAHMVLYFATRWQLGADYAIKRGGKARGPYFPW